LLWTSSGMEHVYYIARLSVVSPTIHFESLHRVSSDSGHGLFVNSLTGGDGPCITLPCLRRRSGRNKCIRKSLLGAEILTPCILFITLFHLSTAYESNTATNSTMGDDIKL
jgi:hypothetical protein